MRVVTEASISERGQHPKGMWLLIFSEMWERFSFFGMKGILVLFLTSAIGQGGFGWEPASAIAFTGLYGGSVYFAGVAGGWLADRFVGVYRSVLIGGFILITGHLLLGGLDVGYWLADRMTGMNVQDLLATTDLKFGVLRLSLEDAAVIQALAGTDTKIAHAFRFVILASSASFYCGVAFIVVGTGLFKPQITVLLGRLFDNSEPQRESGFTLYYVGMNIGSFLAPIIVGTLAEEVNWAIGFAAAAAGMIVAMTVFVLRRTSVHKVSHSKAETKVKTPLSRSQKRQLLGLGILGVFAAVFWIGFEQIFGFLNVFVFNNVDRSVFDFVIPATWFLSLNPLIIIVFAPILAWLWTYLENTGRNPSIVGKFALGLVSLTLAFAVLLLASLTKEAQDAFPMSAVILTYTLVTIAELLLWATSLAFVTRIAPQQVAGAVMGAWYIALALGASLGGIVGAYAAALEVRQAFASLTAISFASFILLLCLRPMLKDLLQLHSPTVQGALPGAQRQSV